MQGSPSTVERLLTHARLKLGLAVTLGALICIPYFWLQTRALHAAPVYVLGIDQWVATDGRWAPVYLSLYLLVLVPPLLSVDGARIREFALGVGTIALISHVVFLVAPTRVSPPLATAGPGLDLIRWADGRGNALPSLHASLAVYTALATARLVGSWRMRSLALPVTWVWTIAVLYATLATRQHVALDLAAGAALAVAVALVLGRRDPETDDRAARERISTATARRRVARGLEGEISALRRLDARRRIEELAVFSAIGVSGAALSWSASATVGITGRVLLLAGIVLAAVGLNAAVLLLHEGMHGTLFRSRVANDGASILLGGTVLMSYTAYRVLHTRHHEYLGDARDPDDYANYTDSRWLLWSMHFVRLVAGAFLYIALIPVLAFRHATPRERAWIAAEYALLVPIWVLVVLFAPRELVLYGWWIPAVCVAAFTGVRGFTQHGITDSRDAFLASRSLRPNRVVAFLLLNENFHLEHHLFPEVPSYNLGRLAELLEPRIPRRVTGRSYSGFVVAFLRRVPALDDSPIGFAANGRAVGPSRGVE